MTAQTQAIAFIPLNRLVASPRNVRRANRKVDIDALAASIAARGLLQNLCVTPAEGDRFEVEAGGRRLLALKLLARSGVIARDFPVPCHVGAVDEGREVSLTENIHRVDMDAMDEVDAYAALVADGSTADDVARRFGVTRRHVDQRLAMSGLSPRIKAAWKRGEVSLEAARAFCLVEDHKQQEAVFRSLGRPVTHAASVRARLMEGRMRASDRLARFVGLEAYEVAGGAILRDLFDADAVYVEDPALMARLAEDRLEAERDGYAAQGWGWTAINLGSGRLDGLSGTRIQPEWRDLTDEEQAGMGRLRSDLDALDAALDLDSVEDDPRWEQRDDLAAAIETLRQEARIWDKELMAHAGVVLSIGHDGGVEVAFGVVRHDDEKAIRAIRKRRIAAAAGKSMGEAQTGDGGSADPCVAEESGLPKGVIRDLSIARTRAVRLMLARNPGASLAVTVAGMIARSAFRSDLAGVGVAAHPARMADLAKLEDIRGAMEAGLPDEECDLLAWCLAQPVETLLSLLAVLVAGSLDLTHEKGSPGDRRRQEIADTLAAALAIDMRDFWTADADYWTRLPKAELLNALADAPTVLDLPAGERETLLRAHAKLRKDELAARVGEAFAGAGYLPDLLVTETAAGGLALTEAAEASIAA